MFNFFVSENEFQFRITNEEGDFIKTSNWANVKSNYLSEFSIVKTLLDNGIAELSEESINVRIEDILSLDEIDRKILGLPDNYPFEIVVELIHNGQGVADIGANILISYYDFYPHGNELEVDLSSPFIKIKECDYIFSADQFALVSIVNEFNSLDKSNLSRAKQMTYFSNIKILSKSIPAKLDLLLESEEYLVKGKIKLNLNLTDTGGVKIYPDIENDFQDRFNYQFQKASNVNDVYSLNNSNGERLRVVIDETPNYDKSKGNQSVKDLLKKVKEKSVFEDKVEIELLVENPEVYLDADYFDIDAFSERVKELGLYKPKFYPFICPYKSIWIPGVMIKDPVLGESKLVFSDEFELKEFSKSIEYAKSQNNNSITWESIEIPIDKAVEIEVISKKQFVSPQVPNNLEQKKELELNGDKVLIIYENVEQLDYQNANANDISSLDFTFEQINNLNSSISLKKHQKEGVAWLQTLYKASARGCLLADDMGLGKTLQILYFLEWYAQNTSNYKPILIVAPVSLLENWGNEYNKFFSNPSIPIRILYDNHSLSKQYKLESVSELQKKQILITNYETIRTYQLNICAVDYSIVVLDEAQKIKTPGTYITNACKALKSDFKIAMTGTPIENTFIDLWCLMDFCTPGLLGNAKEFAKIYQKPLNKSETDVVELGESLRDRIGIFLKRRLKSDIKEDLPAKYDSSNETDLVHFHGNRNYKVKMPEIQLETYKVALNGSNSSHLNGIAKTNQILKSIQAIKTISDHPYLLNRQITNYSAQELVQTSAKLEVVIDILNSIKSKEEKCIIFAERKDTQQMLRKVVFGYFNISPSIVNGDTPSKPTKNDINKSRQETIDYFQSEIGFNVIILSPLAAGVGLNVVGANHVIHYSRHWNPAKEDQATDRAYRIGQEKDVYVYYPMAVFPQQQIENDKEVKSFDEVLDSLLRRKKSLAVSTLYPSEALELNQEDVFDNLFFDASLNPTKLSIFDFDNLNPELFEAGVGLLFQDSENLVQLTPYSNDKGVDVVVIGKSQNLLIQAKQSKNLVGSEGVQEVFTALNFYKKKYIEDFKLIVITNNDFTANALELARLNDVELVNRTKLIDLISKTEIFEKDIIHINNNRLAKI